MSDNRLRTRPTAKPASRRYVQARGETRRKLLFDTALELLRNRHIEDITYQEIAKEAGVPLASCYHFFPGKLELFAALIDHAGPWFRDVTLAALSGPAPDWTTLIERLMDGLAENYNADAAFAQLFSSSKIPRSVYPQRDLAYQQVAQRVLAAIDRQFHRAPLEGDLEIFTFAMRIADAAFAPSLDLYERVTEFHLAEGKRATISYLRNFMPPVLTRRAEDDASTPELAGDDP